MAKIKTKIKRLQLFNTSYDIDVIKDFNNNDISSTSYIRGRTHYLKTEGHTFGDPSSVSSLPSNGYTTPRKVTWKEQVEFSTKNSSIFGRLIYFQISVQDRKTGNTIFDHKVSGRLTKTGFVKTFEIETVDFKDNSSFSLTNFSVNSIDLTVAFEAQLEVITDLTGDLTGDRLIATIQPAFLDDIEPIDQIFLPCQEELAATESLEFTEGGSTVDIDPCETESIIKIPDINPFTGVTVTRITNFSMNMKDKQVQLLYIPASVTEIDTGAACNAFNNCINLQEIVVDEASETYKSIDGNLYSKDSKTFIKYAAGKADLEFVLPAEVTSIGENAFAGCKLTKLVIPATIKSIDTNAFDASTSITELTCPANLLDRVPLNKVQQVTILGTETTDSIPAESFKDNTNLQAVTIGAGIEAIEEEAFAGCTNLINVAFNNNLEKVRDNAFKGCTNLTSITLPDSLEILGKEAFYGCSSLKTVTMGGMAYCTIEETESGGVVNIPFTPASTFANCPNLEYILVRDGESNLYFSDQGNIYFGNELCFYPAGKADIQFNVPNSVTVIQTNAFNNVASLRYIQLPSTLESIKTNAFRNLNLSELVIPDKIKGQIGVEPATCSIEKLSLSADTLNTLTNADANINAQHVIVRNPTATNFYYNGNQVAVAADYVNIFEIEADTTTPAEDYVDNSSSMPDLSNFIKMHTLIIHNGKDRIPNYLAEGLPKSTNVGGSLAHIYVPYDSELFYESTWQDQGATMIDPEKEGIDFLSNIITEYKEVANKDWFMDQLLISKATDSDIANLFI